ncbi:uncharacterized protein LOC127857476 [Dreissena polymorpha]|uniref:uncharacterized protein LOC127857476 n=1 Tax=Dreissena polymorpha TaxID=45954 RepID=UPI002264E889|nr:uncharacterized protein LOC127857476 [Dreissena polymorpha]
MMGYNQTCNAMSRFVLDHTETMNTSGISQDNNITSQSEMITNMYTLETTRFAVQKILVPILTTLGLVGNAISICVLTHKSMVSSTNCNVVNLLILVNSSMNFMLYSAMSTKFRRVFMRMFCYCDRNGIDHFSKTELSFYKGQSMRGSQIPFRFRSHRATKGKKEDGIHTYQHRTRRNNNTCNRHNLTNKTRTFVTEHKGSLSISSSPKNSSRNSQYYEKS